ncbi:hypothetical protein [Acinetobacter sp.]|uniref:hypothetical protein n=1 Tax=Acinetobacter sp. TaxID=472 RepID=UPI003D05492D
MAEKSKKKVAKRGDTAVVINNVVETTVTFKEVISLIHDGSLAVVILDNKGNKGIINSEFVVKDKITGALSPAKFACPAAYDRVAKALSMEEYKAYEAASAANTV